MEQFCGCWTYPRCKDDCYWYDERQDMGGHIPYCRCKKANFIEPKDCENCEQYHSKFKPTKADKIRKMSDEELAQLFVQISLWRKPATYDAVSGFCLDDGVVKEKEWLEWLKQEVHDAELD